jgi:hypothetical protein
MATASSVKNGFIRSEMTMPTKLDRAVRRFAADLL